MAAEWAQNPFEDSGLNLYEFTITRPTNVNQLQSEIAIVTGVSEDDLMVSSASQDGEAPISETNPQTIFVASQVPLKKKDIQSLLDGHVPGPPETVAVNPSGVQIVSDDPALPDTLVKLRSGATLSTKEMSLVLKSIVGG